MAQEDGSDQGGNPRRGRRNRSIPVDAVGPALRKFAGQGKEAVASVAESVTDTVNTVKETRDSVVMVRLDKDSLNSIDILVDCGLTKSRSEAAAFLISEGIKAKSDLYGKIVAKADVIRKARQELQSLLDEEGGGFDVDSDR